MSALLQKITRRFSRRNRTDLTNPVLVYQMGKVASSSIYRSLRSIGGVNVFHIHRMNSENIETVKQEHFRLGASPAHDDLGLYLFKHLIEPKKPAKVITLIREPIGRNISAYFQNLETFEGIKNADFRLQIDELMENFITKYNHDVPLNWFDLEMKTTVGIDVFEHDFPKDSGFQTISRGPYELLLMRHDIEDELKAKLVSDFLSIQSFSIKRENEGIFKKYGPKYEAFLEAIRVPLEYAERMLNSKYAQHFFTTEERETIKRKWTHS